MRKLTAIGLAFGLALFTLAGCSVTRTTVVYQVDPATGKTNAVTSTTSKAPFYDRAIVRQTTRFVGFKVDESTSSETPEVVLGWGSGVTEIIPTAPTAVGVTAPNTMATFKMADTANPFSVNISENSGAGNVWMGGTNDSSRAIIPSAWSPVPAATPAATNSAAAK